MTPQEPALERHTRECFEHQFIFEAPENPYRDCICATPAPPEPLDVEALADALYEVAVIQNNMFDWGAKEVAAAYARAKEGK